jgi:predicted metal-dependent hydrolase
MIRKKKQSEQYSATIEVQGTTLPVLVVFEKRNGFRFAMTRKRIILRLPLGLPPDTVKGYLAQLQAWVTDTAEKKPAVLASYNEKKYTSGQQITVGTRTYKLDIATEDRATHGARLVGNTIFLQLSEKATPVQRAKAIRTLLSRVVAGDYHREIADRIHDMNFRTFKRPIKNVYLKYNHTNWGSCSTDSNVNLSTRLLFAPRDVQDYVILHELAHLVEHNHSDRFWALVEQYMPNYEEKEKWLKKNGPTCDF